MQSTIQNEFLKVTVKAAGAELTSIFHKQKQKELLWNANPEFWSRHAPVLFPIVGKLKNNSFTVSGNSYSLPQHGFARDTDFELLQQSENAVVFTLKSTAETLKKYPFDFELQLKYSLDGLKLNTQYTVINTGENKLPFSIGAHPAFVCPMNENETLADYYLEFEKQETLDRHLLSDGLFNGETERVMTATNFLALNEELFLKDAIVFKNMQSTYMILKSKKSDYTLRFSFEGFPYFGIWSKENSGFLCLEPWCGISDRFDFDGEIYQKEAIETLSPTQIFERVFSVEF